jgi:Xaa-Pro aminopeptidase
MRSARSAQALAPIALVDATELLGELRVVKSPTEIAYLRAAALCAHRAAGGARARPGRAQRDRLHRRGREAAMRRAGSDHWSIPIEMASGAAHARRPRHAARAGSYRRAISCIWNSPACRNRYHVAAIHTLALGEPGRRAREIYRPAVASLSAGIAATRIGAVSAIEEASLVPLSRAGLRTPLPCDRLRHRHRLSADLAGDAQISRGFDRRLGGRRCSRLHACLSCRTRVYPASSRVAPTCSAATAGNAGRRGAVDLEVR